VNFFKRKLPLILVFLAGITLVIAFYIPHPLSQQWIEEGNRYVRIIKNSALLLGVVSLVMHHGRKVRRQQEGFGYSLIVFLFFVPMVFFGLYTGIDAAEAGQSASIGNWMFQNLKVSMESTMYSMLAFYISSAAFRAFRARSFDATVMLAVALFVMIGRVPVGDLVSQVLETAGLPFKLFSDGTNWIMNVPLTGARRAVRLGIALSIVATSVRIIFGIERSYLGRGD
jgi:lysylphosphatidylglycerol synthetase-like protein (DUF2156 family)